jgi:protein gp37
MSKTKIEWCDYTINPVKGLCPMACPYCYARRMYKRFKWDETIRYNEPSDDFYEMRKHPGAKVFIGSTFELFGDWVKHEWIDQILEYCRRVPDTTFIFLTKRPENLIKWSPFPENCWVGVSAVDYWKAIDACGWLDNVDANVKFLSIEPLLAWSSDELNTSAAVNWFSNLNWLIIGQQTPQKPQTTPKVEWVREIIQAADTNGIPVFLKDNLKPLLQQNTHNIYSIPKWAGRQFAVTGDQSLHPTEPHPNEPMCVLRQEFPK